MKFIGFIPEQLELTKLLVSIVIGGLIGIEREYRGKAAGFRTIVLICIGSTLFTIFSIQLGAKNSPDRMAANIITGIGFLGAGAIFRDLNNLTKGLNTAAIIWITAAMGVGIGTGHFILITLSTCILMIILIGFPLVERVISKRHHVRIYKIAFTNNQAITETERVFNEHELKAVKMNFIKKHDKTICIWTVAGNESKHELFTERLLFLTGVLEFEY